MNARLPVAIALFCFVAGAACASEDSPTAEELLAALSYDPKAAAKTVPAPARVPQTPELRKAAPGKPVKSRTTLSSVEKKAVPAAAEPAKNEKKEQKTLKGSLVFVRPTRMAVEFDVNDQGGNEILLQVDPKVKLKRAKRLGDLGYGDKVEVKYVETSAIPQKPEASPAVLSMVATEIVLLKKSNPEVLAS